MIYDTLQNETLNQDIQTSLQLIHYYQKQLELQTFVQEADEQLVEKRTSTGLKGLINHIVDVIIKVIKKIKNWFRSKFSKTKKLRETIKNKPEQLKEVGQLMIDIADRASSNSITEYVIYQESKLSDIQDATIKTVSSMSNKQKHTASKIDNHYEKIINKNKHDMKYVGNGSKSRDIQALINVVNEEKAKRNITIQKRLEMLNDIGVMTGSTIAAAAPPVGIAVGIGVIAAFRFFGKLMTEFVEHKKSSLPTCDMIIQTGLDLKHGCELITRQIDNTKNLGSIFDIRRIPKTKVSVIDKMDKWSKNVSLVKSKMKSGSIQFMDQKSRNLLIDVMVVMSELEQNYVYNLLEELANALNDLKQSFNSSFLKTGIALTPHQIHIMNACNQYSENCLRYISSLNTMIEIADDLFNNIHLSIIEARKLFSDYYSNTK